jgi:hypothetical protein
MPREEPVMTATFPVRSNKLMFHSLHDLLSFRDGPQDRTRNLEIL